MTADDIARRGWDGLDFILITGDAYVDHPSFGAAIISRLLESRGYTVGILSQPDFTSAKSFRVLGKPRLAFLITSGNIDSMVNHYTVSKKKRAVDVYSPGGKPGLRPDRAAIAYSIRVREAYGPVPIILGGLEAAQAMGITMIQIRFLEANIWLKARRFAKADPIYKDLDGKLEKSDVALFWYNWAETALGLDDYDGYLARLGKAIEAEPDTYKPMLPDALVAVAIRYQERGETARYIEYLTKAVNANPLSAALHLTLGDALWQAGTADKAIEQYRLVLELEPDHKDRVRLLNRIRGEETAGASSTRQAP